MQFTGEVRGDLICPVCLNVFQNPVQGCCGHIYCNECLTQTFQQARSTSCAVCRATLTKDGLSPNILARTLVGELHVRCCAQKQQFKSGDKVSPSSFEWIGSCAEYLDKHKKQCPHRIDETATDPGKIMAGKASEKTTGGEENQEEELEEEQLLCSIVWKI